MTEHHPSNVYVVYDVNVLINAVSPHEPGHLASLRTLTDTHGYNVAISDKMLKTTAHQLLHFGADPKVVDEFIEYIMDPSEDGLGVTVLDQVPVRDYGITDRNGLPDFEDSTVVAVLDEVGRQTDSQTQTILVTRDGSLQDWCVNDNRAVITPRRFVESTRTQPHADRRLAIEYIGKRMFRDHDTRLRTYDQFPIGKKIKTRSERMVEDYMPHRTGIGAQRQPEPKSQPVEPKQTPQYKPRIQAGDVYRRYPEHNRVEHIPARDEQPQL